VAAGETAAFSARPAVRARGLFFYFGVASYGFSWGRPVLTWVAKPLEHAEVVDNLVNPVCKLLVANDDNYALAA